MTIDKIKELEERSIGERDAAVANEAYDEYVKEGKNSRPINELWEELNLWSIFGMKILMNL